MRPNHPIQRSLGSELVLGGLEGVAGELRNHGSNLVAEAFGRVEPGADRGAAHGQTQQPTCRVLNFGDRVPECGRVSGPLLSDGQRGCILEVSSTDLHNGMPLARLLVQSLLEALEGRDGLLNRHLVRGDVHRSGEGVVGRLPHIDVIVRMDGLL